MSQILQITRQSGPHGEKRADPSEERFDEDDAGPTFPTLATYRGFRIQRSFRRRSEVQFTAATLCFVNLNGQMRQGFEFAKALAVVGGSAAA